MPAWQFSETCRQGYAAGTTRQRVCDRAGDHLHGKERARGVFEWPKWKMMLVAPQVKKRNEREKEREKPQKKRRDRERDFG